MKILKRVKNDIEITKPLLDLAREYDIELRFQYEDEIEDGAYVLVIHSCDDDNAFIEYKVDFNQYYMEDFKTTYFSSYEMEDVPNIPQTLATSGDFKSLFIAVKTAFKK